MAMSMKPSAPICGSTSEAVQHSATENVQVNDESGYGALTTPQTGVPAPAQPRAVSEHLRQASRTLAMQSGSRRGIYRVLGLRARPRDRVFQVLFPLAFVLFFLAPMAAGVTYLVGFVTPQYEAETRFVLRSALPALSDADRNRNSSESMASLKIVQDTLVVASFLESPSLVQQLNARLPLDSLYGRAEVDALSRLAPDQSFEDKARYFEDFIDVNVSSASGIVTVALRAFTPQEARDALQEVFELAEVRVNQLNTEIWASVLDAAQRNFDTAAEQLRQTRTRYAVLQNETGVFDVELEAEVLADVIKTLRTELSDLENRRDTLLLEVAADHINVVRFSTAIDLRRAQLSRLEAELASAQGDSSTLSNNQKLFDALETEIEVAQERFKVTAAELEEAKLMSTIQMLYLEKFVQPAVPEDSVYPVLYWEISKLALICLALWAVAALALSVLQRRLD